MDLVVDQVGEFQDVHVANRDLVVIGLTGATVEERRLSVGADEAVAVNTFWGEVAQHLLNGRMLTGLFDLVPVGTVEDWCRHEDRWIGARTSLPLDTTHGRIANGLTGCIRPSPPSAITEVRFKHLANVHSAWNTERVKDDVDG